MNYQIDLAIQTLSTLDDRPTKVATIAQKLDVNQTTLHRVVNKLVNANILSSRKGPNGGVYRTGATTVREIVNTFESNDNLSEITKSICKDVYNKLDEVLV